MPMPPRDLLDEAGSLERWSIALRDDSHPEIPIPTDARVVTIAARTEGDSYHIRADLEVPGDAAGAQEFYREQLAARDWEEVARLTWRSPDGYRGAVGTVSAFCRGPSGPMFLVAIMPKAGWVSDVHVRITSVAPSACAGPAPPEPLEPDEFEYRLVRP
ncbi:MAG: hypothetical protein M3O34_11370 [Chloroflexota bacterium]|nr:hypothetical protein [Chloroflexota bacterium]